MSISNTARAFRFGVGSAFVRSGEDVRALARRIEDLGFDSMVVPDGLGLPAPFPLLAAAAAATTRLHLATHVLAAPLHSPALVARDCDTLDVVSDGRFHLGVGTGTPDVVRLAARAKAEPDAPADHSVRPLATGADRRRHLTDILDAVARRFAAGGRPAPPVLLAGTGPRLLELAAERAATVALPVPHEHDESALIAKSQEFRAIAGPRFDRIELSSNVLAIGEGDLPPWVPPEFRHVPADSHSRLRGKPSEIADVLRRRRDATGISYVTVPQFAIDDFAPVVELLAET